MAINKAEAIAKFVDTGKPCCFGSLRCTGDTIYTYDVLLAKVDRKFKTVHLNIDRYSVTSSRHRNLVEAAVLSTHITSTGWELIKTTAEEVSNA